MKTYTRRGDSGQTSIWGGRSLSKDHTRMEAIGAVDECNAAIGSALASGLPEAVASILRMVQGRLFIVGTELMAPDYTGSGSNLPRLADDDITGLEAAIDSLEHALPELQNFIVPGGSVSGAALHVARGACRRAERTVATLSRTEGTAGVVLAYLNRLADLLFVAARYANHAAGVPDVLWSGASSRSVVPPAARANQSG
jgi:cob(I)alamin adenosyltransferase